MRKISLLFYVLLTSPGLGCSFESEPPDGVQLCGDATPRCPTGYLCRLEDDQALCFLGEECAADEMLCADGTCIPDTGCCTVNDCEINSPQTQAACRFNECEYSCDVGAVACPDVSRCAPEADCCDGQACDTCEPPIDSECDPFDHCGCTGDTVCRLTSGTSSELYCAAAGPSAENESCEDHGDCAAGLGCSHGSCLPYCMLSDSTSCAGECLELAGDLGACHQACESSESGCPPDHVCSFQETAGGVCKRPYPAGECPAERIGDGQCDGPEGSGECATSLDDSEDCDDTSCSEGELSCDGNGLYRCEEATWVLHETCEFTCTTSGCSAQLDAQCADPEACGGDATGLWSVVGMCYPAEIESTLLRGGIDTDCAVDLRDALWTARGYVNIGADGQAALATYGGLELTVDYEPACFAASEAPVAQETCAMFAADHTAREQVTSLTCHSSDAGCTCLLLGSAPDAISTEAVQAQVVAGNYCRDNATLSLGLQGEQNGGLQLVRGQTSASQVRLAPSRPQAGSYFGFRISADGTTLVATAPFSDEAAGSVYVFVRDGVQWSQQAVLRAENAEPGDQFGFSVEIDGDTIVVGAPREASARAAMPDDNTTLDAGAAYVFVREGSVWRQEGYLKASNAGAGDLFGWHVTVSGDTVAVSARDEDGGGVGVNPDGDNDNIPQSGATYVFTREGGAWMQEAYLKASNTGNNDNFGWGIDLHADTLVVGTPYEDSAALGIDGDQSDNSEEDAGAAYVFVRKAGVWSQQAYLKSPDNDPDDVFGNEPSIWGDTIVVGAGREDSNARGVDGNPADNNATNSGAAYVFVRDGETWTQQAYLKATNAQTEDQFGAWTDLEGDLLLVGSFLQDGSATEINGEDLGGAVPNSGAAYLFERTGNTWRQRAYVKPRELDAEDNFGVSVTIAQDYIAVDSPFSDSASNGINVFEDNDDMPNSGSTFIFPLAQIP